MAMRTPSRIRRTTPARVFRRHSLALLAATFDGPGAFDANVVPAGSLVLAHVSDATVQANAQTALLKELLRVPELGGSPIFVLHER